MPTTRLLLLSVALALACGAPSVGLDGGDPGSSGGRAMAGGGAAGGSAMSSGGGDAGGASAGGSTVAGGRSGGTSAGGNAGGLGGSGGGSAGGTTAGGASSGGAAGGMTGGASGGAAGGTAGGVAGGVAGGSAGGAGPVDAGRPPLDGGLGLGAVSFTQNAAGSDDYGQLTQLPTGFGQGEFTFELWIKPDSSFPTGACADGTTAQRTQWCTSDRQPASAGDWWFKGNFLLDGHNNASFGAGTFSLQLYGGGRLRWTLGDQGSPGQGDLWGVQAWPATTAPSLLDRQWHHVACIRRWQGTTQARLELWVDGVQRGTTVSDVRTNLWSLWQAWSTFPSAQRGWFFGAEKQSAIGTLSQYEDYKGLVSELRFWSRPLAASELAPPAYARAIAGTEPGLVGWFRFHEGSGTTACDWLSPSRCMTFFRVQQPFWR